MVRPLYRDLAADFVGEIFFVGSIRQGGDDKIVHEPEERLVGNLVRGDKDIAGTTSANHVAGFLMC